MSGDLIDITQLHSLLNNRSLISISERGYSCKKDRNLNHCTQLINGKINILGSSGHINEVKLSKIIQVGISQCCLLAGLTPRVAEVTGWPHQRSF